MSEFDCQNKAAQLQVLLKLLVFNKDDRLLTDDSWTLAYYEARALVTECVKSINESSVKAIGVCIHEELKKVKDGEAANEAELEEKVHLLAKRAEKTVYNYRSYQSFFRLWRLSLSIVIGLAILAVFLEELSFHSIDGWREAIGKLLVAGAAALIASPLLHALCSNFVSWRLAVQGHGVRADMSAERESSGHAEKGSKEQ